MPADVPGSEGINEPSQDLGQDLADALARAYETRSLVTESSLSIGGGLAAWTGVLDLLIGETEGVLMVIEQARSEACNWDLSLLGIYAVRDYLRSELQTTEGKVSGQVNDKGIQAKKDVMQAGQDALTAISNKKSAICWSYRLSQRF